MIRNFVLETAQAPGTNPNVVLTGSPQDYTPWRVAFLNGQQAFYFLDDGFNAEWGVCTVHWGPPDYISRDTVIGNTIENQIGEGATAVNFQTPIQVYNEIPGTRMPFVQGNILWCPNAYVDSHSGGVPIGASMDYWGTVAPIGWVFCDGRWLSQAQYPFLFAVIGNGYNQASNPGFFQVPDCQGAVTYGKDNPAPGSLPGNGRLGPFQSAGLGVSIGDWRLDTHNHALAMSDPGHTHVVADSQHRHRMDDAGHAHAYNQASIVPGTGLAAGSNFTLAQIPTLTDGGGLRGSNIGNPPPFSTFTYSGGANEVGVEGPVGIFFAATGIAISIAPAGTGVGWQNLSPGIVCNKIIYAGPAP